jgi:hypothetical protein
VVDVALVLTFGPGDAARCRFAVSPLQETMSAVMVLMDRRRQGWYLPWLREVRPALARLDLGLLSVAAPANGHGPDFLWPSPGTARTTVEEDLDRVRATDPRIVAAELAEHARRLDPRTVPADLYRALVEDPARTRDRLVEQQRLAWQALVAPLWERILILHDADITHRARQLADGGLEGLLANLHPRAVWDGAALRLTGPAPGTVDLRGRGLVLVPTAFGWPDLGIGPTDDTSTASPALAYPMLGVGRLWESTARSPALARLLGPTRASVLAETNIPSSTTTLARRMRLAPATVSEHLAVLRDAGLVVARRRGRELRYQQTELASALLRSDAGEPAGFPD